MSKALQRYPSFFLDYGDTTNESKGVVGSATGSEAWQSSAESDKQAGIDAMKAASANRDPQQSGFGKV